MEITVGTTGVKIMVSEMAAMRPYDAAVRRSELEDNRSLLGAWGHQSHAHQMEAR
jgi:hypothetical protein